LQSSEFENQKKQFFAIFFISFKTERNEGSISVKIT